MTRGLRTQPESRPPKTSWWAETPREQWKDRVEQENAERIRDSKEAYSAPMNGQPRP